MDYQNTTSQSNASKFPKRTLVLIGIIGLVILAGLGFFILNRDKAPAGPEFVEDTSTTQIERGNIPGVGKFEKDGISFSFPSDYKVREVMGEKGFYEIYNTNEQSGEAKINIDTRRQGEYSDFNQAVNYGKDNLTEQVQKNIPGGVKMFGKRKSGPSEGVPTLSVYLKYGNGALVVWSSNMTLNEAVFDQVVASIKTE